MIVVRDPEEAETALTAGELACPHCAGRLRPWAYARPRPIRFADATVRVQPRRARCAACQRSQVLVPAACQPRRADATEVIGTALVRHALGAGYRQIALALDRSPWTTRSWLRAARPAAHRSALYRRGVEHLALVDPTA